MHLLLLLLARRIHMAHTCTMKRPVAKADSACVHARTVQFDYCPYASDNVKGTAPTNVIIGKELGQGAFGKVIDP